MDLFVAVHEDVEMASSPAAALFAGDREAVLEANRVADQWGAGLEDPDLLRELAEESELTDDDRQAGVVYRRVYSLEGARVTVLRCPAP